MRNFILILLIFALNSCAVKELKPIKRYDLTVDNTISNTTSRHKNKILKVAYPISLSMPLSYKIKYSYENGDSGYYLNSIYGSNLSQQLNGFIIRTLSKANIFKTVLPYQSNAIEDYRLEVVVNKFYHKIDSSGSWAVIDIGFNLLDANTNKIIKSRVFSYKKPTPTVDANGFIIATKEALKELSSDLVNWLK